MGGHRGEMHGLWVGGYGGGDGLWVNTEEGR